MTPDEAIAWVTAHHAPATRAQPLSGGLLNHVFRVWLADPAAAGRASVVLKRAPPHVASDPSVPLDPGRSEVEAEALSWAQAQGHPVPALLHAAENTLLLEDLGDLPDLTTWLAEGGDPSVVDRLAAWLRGLHDAPGPGLANRPMQEARLAVQYGAVTGWLEALDIHGAAHIGRVAREVGEELCEPGDAFVMGDLWPPSIRVKPDGSFVLIDWELATTGRRGQDVGHLAAHLDLEALAGRLPRSLSVRFTGAYGSLSRGDARLTAIHHACELLARSVGAFPRGDLSDAARRNAVGHAVWMLRAVARVR